MLAFAALSSWFPKNPGLASGFGSMSIGIGTMTSVKIVHTVIVRYGVIYALFITGLILGISQLMVSQILDLPANQTAINTTMDANSPLTGRRFKTISSWKHMLTIRQYWIYFLVILSSTFPYATMIYFHVIGLTFGASIDDLVGYYQLLILVSVLGRLVVGGIADHLKTRTGFFSRGSKNVLLLLLLVETIAFLCLIPISAAVFFPGFLISSGCLFLVYGASAALSIVAALEHFGKENSALVFGVGGSIAIAVADFGSLLLAKESNRNSQSASPSDYTKFYIFSAVLSSLGLIACFLFQRFEELDFDTIEEGNKTVCNAADGSLQSK